MRNNELEEVAVFAIEKHMASNCRYANGPYEGHLHQVHSFACKYMELLLNCLPLSIDSQNYLSATTQVIIRKAAYCHDLLEDCPISYKDLVREVGVEVSEIVYAVTNELAKTRFEKALKTLPKTAEIPFATYIKLCDRIANVQFSAKSLESKDTSVNKIGRAMMDNYLKEKDVFNAILGAEHYKTFSNLFDDLNRSYVL